MRFKLHQHYCLLSVHNNTSPSSSSSKLPHIFFYFLLTLKLTILLSSILSRKVTCDSPLICPSHWEDHRSGKLKLCVSSRERLRLGDAKRMVSVKPLANLQCLKEGCRCYSIRLKVQLLDLLKKKKKRKKKGQKCLQISLPPRYEHCPGICPTCQCLVDGETPYRLHL